MLDAVQAHGPARIEEMRARGEVLDVPNGTRAEVVDVGFDSTKVRVGEFEGWVLRGYVQRPDKGA
jgi:hypothetical protein